ncbi:MAG: hypothetical protein ACT4N4_13280 [Rhodospirillales bacterium]
MRRAVLLAAVAIAGAPAVLAQDLRQNCFAVDGYEKIEACAAALKAAPKDLALRRALARAYIDVGDGVGGASEYGAIARERPEDPEAWYDYALALATDYRYREAASAIDHALKLDPDRPAANKIAVIAYEGAGRIADAYGAGLRLAGMGDAIAMYETAEALVKGRGVKADPPAAVPWFRRAAEAGHVDAMAALAKIYAEGLYGEKPDPAQAAQWKKKSE